MLEQTKTICTHNADDKLQGNDTEACISWFTYKHYRLRHASGKHMPVYTHEWIFRARVKRPYFVQKRLMLILSMHAKEVKVIWE